MKWKSLAFLAVLVLGACKPKPPPDAGKVLIWARGAESGTLDPAEVESGEDAKIVQNIYEPLVTFKADSVELEGRLATKWSFSADGKQVTFDLRPGVRFHDGTPLTADSVVFSFQRLIDQKHPFKPKQVPYASVFKCIQRVDALGSDKVVMTLTEPTALFLYYITLFGATIVSPDAVKKHGEKFAQNPCGTGPYRLTRWERDVKIELEAFADYWGAKPPINRVIVVPVASPQTAIEKLRKGEVHVVDHPTTADVRTLEGDPGTKVQTGPSMNVLYLSFNLEKPPYNDLNFRRAVSLALDRSALVTLGYYGLAEPARNIVPPVIWRDAAPTPEYEYNLEKAKEFLAKVKLDSKVVELYHFTWSRPYAPEPQRVAEWVKDQLRKIGLEVKLSGFDKAGYEPKTKDAGHPMLLYGWIADWPDPDNFFYPLLHGKSAGDLNVSFFRDAVFDDSVAKAQSEIDLEKRRQLYAKAYERYREELPTVPLVHVKQLIGLSKKVTYTLHPIEYRFYQASLKE